MRFLPRVVRRPLRLQRRLNRLQLRMEQSRMQAPRRSQTRLIRANPVRVSRSPPVFHLNPASRGTHATPKGATSPCPLRMPSRNPSNPARLLAPSQPPTPPPKRPPRQQLSGPMLHAASVLIPHPQPRRLQPMAPGVAGCHPLPRPNRSPSRVTARVRGSLLRHQRAPARALRRIAHSLPLRNQDKDSHHQRCNAWLRRCVAWLSPARMLGA